MENFLKRLFRLFTTILIEIFIFSTYWETSLKLKFLTPPPLLHWSVQEYRFKIIYVLTILKTFFQNSDRFKKWLNISKCRKTNNFQAFLFSVGRERWNWQKNGIIWARFQTFILLFYQLEFIKETKKGKKITKTINLCHRSITDA